LQIEEFARREVVTGLNDVVNDDKLTVLWRKYAP
jgi:hypothetical protein